MLYWIRMCLQCFSDDATWCYCTSPYRNETQRRSKTFSAYRLHAKAVYHVHVTYNSMWPFCVVKCHLCIALDRSCTYVWGGSVVDEMWFRWDVMGENTEGFSGPAEDLIWGERRWAARAGGRPRVGRSRFSTPDEATLGYTGKARGGAWRKVFGGDGKGVEGGGKNRQVLHDTPVLVA